MPKNKIIEDTTVQVPIYTQDDFVFCKKPNGEITSCGYRIDSTLMRNNQSPFVVYTNSNNDLNNDNNVASIFRNKTVPMGIYHHSGKAERLNFDIEDDIEIAEIEDDLYDKLLEMVNASTPISHKKFTKKINKKNDNRKTKKNRV